VILVVDLSYRPGSLSTAEFVLPVERAVRDSGEATRILHYTEVAPGDLAPASGAILCGTAIADFGYLGGLGKFSWVPGFPRPILGICAGMEVLVRICGGDLIPGTRIGMAAQEVTDPDPLFSGRGRFEAYELHSLAVRLPPSFRALAVSPSGISAARHRERPVYGVMFHPEVRNEWLIRRFVALCGPETGGRGDALMGDEGQRGM